MSAPRDDRVLEVVVAVPTFRRPADLGRLLAVLPDRLAEVAADTDLGPGHRVAVLVVDNDPDGGARAQVEAGPGVRYVHEPRPGLAAVRNRALAAAGSDLLVFLDDDEVPHPDWLVHLLRTRRATDAHAVAGRVVSVVEGDLDPWVAAGSFFARRSLPTGTPITMAATNNLLVDLRRVRATGLTFDDRFGFSGGEDSVFTSALVTGGGRMVWCDEAVVDDVVVPDRATRSWVLRRGFSYGNSGPRVALAVLPPGGSRLAVRARFAGRGVVRLVGGGLRWGLGRVTGSTVHEARGARTAWRGAGMLAGVVGFDYAEYGRTGRRTRWRRAPTAAR